jgi:serine/threonine protein kinase
MPTVVPLPGVAQKGHGRWNELFGYEETHTLQIIMERYDISLSQLVRARLLASSTTSPLPLLSPSSTPSNIPFQSVITQAEFVHVMQSLLSVLVHLSAHGFCHRDIKVYTTSPQVFLVSINQCLIFVPFIDRWIK